MSQFTTTQPEFSDVERTLLGKIAQSLSDQPSVIITKTVSIGPEPLPAVKILDANPKRRRAIIQNMSGVTSVFVGGPNANFNGPQPIGWPIFPQQPVNNPGPSSRLDIATTGELWGSSTGVQLIVMEFLVT